MTINITRVTNQVRYIIGIFDLETRYDWLEWIFYQANKNLYNMKHDPSENGIFMIEFVNDW